MFKLDPFTISLLILTIGGLLWSLYKDREKTIASLNIAKSRLSDIGGDILGILALVALFLAIIPENFIESILGGSSALLSTLYGSITGTITIIPAFVAFPLAASLVQKGAYLVAVAAFITTLTMVGFATAPIEIEHFGKKFTLIRNILSFIIAILIAIGMMVIL